MLIAEPVAHVNVKVFMILSNICDEAKIFNGLKTSKNALEIFEYSSYTRQTFWLAGKEACFPINFAMV